MSFDLVLFGGTGDLTRRKLMPALLQAFRHGKLPPGGRIIAVARDERTDDAFRELIWQSFAEVEEAKRPSDEEFARFAQLIFYRRMDLSKPEDYAGLKHFIDKRAPDTVVLFLATSPHLFPQICEQLGLVGLNGPHVRVVLEKPLGHDLASAEAINRVVRAAFREEQALRIDHYLGKPAVQNLTALRFGNALFEPLWRRESIASIQITIAESIGVGTRGDFYDRTGALRDMIQNHALQLLTMIAMEPPSSNDADAIRDEKLKVLKSLKPFTAETVVRDVVRGQYRKGIIDGEPVKGYLEEAKVPADSATETFVALRAEVQNWRWAGVPFYLRTGKRLPARDAQIVVNFRTVPHPIFSGNTRANQLLIKLQPEDGLELRLLAAKGTGQFEQLMPVSLDLDFDKAFPSDRVGAYERLLMDAIAGRLNLFVRSDEQVQAWRWVEPILQSWARGGGGPRPYAAGTWGPPASSALVARDGFVWVQEEQARHVNDVTREEDKMMRKVVSVLLLWLAALPAAAAFHLWTMNEAYSNADGTVQFLELTALSGGQQFMAGHTLRSSNGTTTNTFSFTTNLPGDTANKRMLLATQGFASLGLVTPDYILPAGFLFVTGGTLTFAEGADAWSHGVLPTDGLSSLNRDGSTAANSPTNFAGATGSIAPPSPVTANPTRFDFGGQSMRTTSPAQAIVFTNGGTSTVTGIAVTITAPFAVTHNCSNLAAGATCNATVTFTPTGEGAASANLMLQGSATAQAAMSGTGEKSLVTHYYRSILRRAPDSAGKSFWNSEAARVQALGASVNEVWYALAGSFYGSAEYLGQNRDNAGFVTDLYTTFFNRAPDSAGFADWTGKLAAGMPREAVLASFMFSGEFATFTQAIFGTTTTRKEIDTVVDFYRGLLGRLPDDSGFAFWRQRFRTAQCQGASAVTVQAESISSLFATGAEYSARGRTNGQYVGDLYNAFLRRGGDLEGVQFWINQIATGARTRENVRQQFVASPEFSARVSAVIAEGCLQ